MTQPTHETPQQFEHNGTLYLVTKELTYEGSVGELGHSEQWTVTAVPTGEAKEFTLTFNHEDGSWHVEEDKT